MRRPCWIGTFPHDTWRTWVCPPYAGGCPVRTASRPWSPRPAGRIRDHTSRTRSDRYRPGTSPPGSSSSSSALKRPGTVQRRTSCTPSSSGGSDTSQLRTRYTCCRQSRTGTSPSRSSCKNSTLRPPGMYPARKEHTRSTPTRRRTSPQGTIDNAALRQSAETARSRTASRSSTRGWTGTSPARTKCISMTRCSTDMIPPSMQRRRSVLTSTGESRHHIRCTIRRPQRAGKSRGCSQGSR